ncbi:hypothetical protein OAW63_02720 [Flavobacteriaceae bacterium]|nr:hypothetical protein [Flavobacteriaceae bacterium]
MKRRENIDEFKVPTNYFDEFENHLLNKINEEVLPKNIGFKTPPGYFNKLDAKIKRKNNSKSKEGKLIPVVSKKKFIYAASLAAIVILVFSVIKDSTRFYTLEEIEISNIENFINEGNIQLKQHEISILFTDEILNNMTSNQSRLSGNQLENYLLENINDLNALLPY